LQLVATKANVNVVMLTGNKKLLSNDELTSDHLVYDPLSYAKVGRTTGAWMVTQPTSPKTSPITHGSEFVAAWCRDTLEPSIVSVK
jgi:hypothetical protein